MPRNRVSAAATGLPSTTLHENHSLLELGLSKFGRQFYSQHEREARSYLRSALRQTSRLIEVRS